MSSFNRFIAMGRLSKNPVLEEKKGKQLCNFDIAIDDGFGKYKKTTYITVTCWGKQAVFVSEHFIKGAGIFVEGRLTQDRWLDKDSGKNRTRHRITAERVNFPTGTKKNDYNNDQGDEEPECLDDLNTGWETEYG